MKRLAALLLLAGLAHHHARAIDPRVRVVPAAPLPTAPQVPPPVVQQAGGVLPAAPRAAGPVRERAAYVPNAASSPVRAEMPLPTGLTPANAGAACAPAGDCAPCDSGSRPCLARLRDWLCFKPTAGDALPKLRPQPYIGPVVGIFPCTSAEVCAGGSGCGPSGCAPVGPGGRSGSPLPGRGPRGECVPPADDALPGYRFAPASPPPAPVSIYAQPAAPTSLKPAVPAPARQAASKPAAAQTAPKPVNIAPVVQTPKPAPYKPVATTWTTWPVTKPSADPWPDTPPPHPVRTGEIPHDTTQVWPPAPPAVVPVQPEPRPGPTVTLVPPAPALRPLQIREDAPPKVWEDSRPEARTETPVVELHPIIRTGHSAPAAPSPANAPWLNPTPVAPLPVMPVGSAPAAPPAPVPIQTQAVQPAAPAAPATPTRPTVVVVREQGEARPAYHPPPPEPHGVTLGTEALLGIALGAAGLGFGYAGWRRKAAAATPPAAATPAAPPGPSDGILLMGKYNAGPRQDTAERFEIGMSYEAERQEKKKAAEQDQGAVLEFILSQNIALHADLAAADPELPEAEELPDAEDNPGERKD